MRIQKALAHLGLGSRRACEEMVGEGRVVLDGLPVQIGQSITQEELGRLVVDGRPVGVMPKKRYLLLNKSAGYVTTVADPQGRPTVMDLLPDDAVVGDGRLYPVGRLDRETTGVLLFTNDGELAHRLLHPSGGVEKEYHAQFAGAATPAVLQALRKGPVLKDGPTHPPKRVELQGDRIVLVIKEGRKRQVRRMLAQVGLECLQLERVRFGNLDARGVARGHYRELSPQEVTALRGLCRA